MAATLSTRRGVIGGLGAAFALAGCNGLSISGPAPKLYTLTPKSTFGDDLPEMTSRLSVEVPTATAGLNSARIALRPTPTTLEYYAGASWIEVIGARSEVERVQVETQSAQQEYQRITSAFPVTQTTTDNLRATVVEFTSIARQTVHRKPHPVRVVIGAERHRGRAAACGMPHVGTCAANGSARLPPPPGRSAP